MSTSTKLRKSKVTSLDVAATGTALATPTTAMNKIAVHKLIIATRGTTAGVMTIWASAHASTPLTDTTYTDGTDKPLAVLSFIPSATLAPIEQIDFPPTRPWCMGGPGVPLRVTTVGDLDVDITVHYDEV